MFKDINNKKQYFQTIVSHTQCFREVKSVGENHYRLFHKVINCVPNP